MNTFDLLRTPLMGRNLIEASAGTGKTFTIAGIYLRLIIELRLPVTQILVVTFTEAATKELRSRIRERLTAAEDALATGNSSDPFLSAMLQSLHDTEKARGLLVAAIRSFDEAAIHTIHGFCQRMLQESPFESGSLYNTELVTDEQELLKEIAADYWRIHCYHGSRPMVQAALDAGLGPETLLKLAKTQRGNPLIKVLPALEPPIVCTGTPDDETLTAWLLHFQRRFFDYLARELPQRKRQKNIRFFEDLLRDLHDAVSGAGSSFAGLIRERYRAALIDEFQDTDPTQFSIFDKIYPPHDPTPFFLIGDPKQAIYSFRGADIFAYLDAAESPLTCHTLGENWRSEPRLVAAVNSLFASRPESFLMEKIKFQPVQPADRQQESLLQDGAPDTSPFRIWFSQRKDPGKPINKGEAGESLVKAVAGEISDILGRGARGTLCIGQRPVAPGDIAVLVRTNRQARLVQRALRRFGIPSVLCSTGNLFESAEAAAVLHFLRAVADPANERLVTAALVTGLMGVSGDDLALLRQTESAWETVLEEFSSYHDLWDANGCMTMARQFMACRRVRVRMLALPDGRRALTNILHCFEAIHEAAARQRLGMEGLVVWLADRINEKPKREEHEIRLESDGAAVQLVTIHKSKGMEYPIVFCPFCWVEPKHDEGPVLFHDDGRVTTIDIGSADFELNRQQAAREKLAENLRLLYVALTRARHRCYLSWGAFKDAGSSALNYLFHQETCVGKGQVSSSDEAICEDLQRLRHLSGDAIIIQPTPTGEGVPYQEPALTAAICHCRTFSGTIDHDWRVASFTSFAAASHHTSPAMELPDRDKAGASHPINPVADETSPTGIFAFPRGAAAGIFFHEVFEGIDFTRAAETAPPIVADLLKRHGLPPEWQATVLRTLDDVLGSTLTAGSATFSLAEIGLNHRLTELEFFFPLAAISTETFKKATARWRSFDLPSNFAEMTTQLAFQPVKGMLRGFIDLVFEHGDRFYIIDWKSNHLGNRQEHYLPRHLEAEMNRNLYNLQYLLYSVALHRYLQMRLPGYDYDTHFGGAFYVFIRGASRGSDCGIFHDLPPKRVVEDLSQLLVEHRP